MDSILHPEQKNYFEIHNFELKKPNRAPQNDNEVEDKDENYDDNIMLKFDEDVKYIVWLLNNGTLYTVGRWLYSVQPPPYW